MKHLILISLITVAIFANTYVGKKLYIAKLLDRNPETIIITGESKVTADTNMSKCIDIYSDKTSVLCIVK